MSNSKFILPLHLVNIEDIGNTGEKNESLGEMIQGASDFPAFAQFPVEEGINSVYLTPDPVIRTINAIAR